MVITRSQSDEKEVIHYENKHRNSCKTYDTNAYV